MSGINYKISLREKMNEYHKLFPDYTFSQIILSTLKYTDGYEGFHKHDLFSLSDEDLYTAMENSLRKEKEKLAKYGDN